MAKKNGLSTSDISKITVSDCNKWPILYKIPEFYRNIIVCFNKAKKATVQLKKDVFEPSDILWGNDKMLFKKKCLYFREWINSDIIYLKDLFHDGKFLDDLCIFKKLKDKRHWMGQLKTIKKVLRKCNLEELGKKSMYCNIKQSRSIFWNKHFIDIHDITTKSLYEMLLSQKAKQNTICKQWSRILGIESLRYDSNQVNIMRIIWKQTNKRISDFCYKGLHNKLPFGVRLQKWNKELTENCLNCGSCETMIHALYECTQIRQLWKDLSSVMKVKLDLKDVLFGKYEEDTIINNTINEIIAITKYCIYCVNNKSRRDVKGFLTVQVRKRLLFELRLRVIGIEQYKKKDLCMGILLKIIQHLE